ncbi:SDR family oxidoreductase [bacterium]|nr:MAG: SDR family oxidoreductase [bacterium]
MKKALVIGASGLVGSYLYRALANKYEIQGTFFRHQINGLLCLDITQVEGVQGIISSFRPGLVFLPAAFTNVDLAEEQKDVCRQINVEAVRNVVSGLQGRDDKLIYFSTDYIFDGKNGPWPEDAEPKPLNVYGSSKFDAEKIIQESLSNYLIIRSTWVYGWEIDGRNFVQSLIRRLNNREIVKVPLDQIATPTYAGDLADIVCRLVNENKSGVYNIAGSSLISRMEFAYLVAEVFGLDKSLILGVKTEDLVQQAKRPLNAGLKTGKIEQELKIRVPTAKESLLRMQKERINVD